MNEQAPTGFICIYCRLRYPDVVPSEAHVFPYVIGGSEATEDTVCRGCNLEINRAIEMPALNSFVALQSQFGIKGRRGRVRRVPGLLRAEGLEARVALNENGEIDGAVVIPTEESGKKGYFIFGPKEAVEEQLTKLKSRYPDLKWEEQARPGKAHVEVELEARPARLVLRRLAAKVAFERFAQIWSADFAADPEYDAVRDFILAGCETVPCCGVVANRAIADGTFQTIGPPFHFIYIVSHPADPILGAFVSFYGLYHYWVVLSTRYRALGQTENMLLENPQTRTAETPRLRARLGHIRFPWRQLVDRAAQDPLGAERDAARLAIEKFQRAADEFYRGREESDDEPDESSV